MNESSSYPPSHPCYYRDHAPLPVAAIEPANAALYDIPQSRERREAELAKAQRELRSDIKRYLDLVENGENALSDFDRACGYLHVSLSLKYSHISYHKGLITALKQALGPEQAALF